MLFFACFCFLIFHPFFPGGRPCVMLRCGMQFCRSTKVRSTQHSGVDYYYSKCTPISSARQYDAKDAPDDRSDLQDLIRYLDSQKSNDLAVDTLDERANVVMDDLSDRANTVPEIYLLVYLFVCLFF